VTGDRAIRWTAVAAVLAVAVVAAYVSYWHAVDVVTGNGEPGTIAHLYPIVIDGIIVAASMVLLDVARHSETAPKLAWWLLGSGVAVTLAANVTFGAESGVAAALWAAWPAAAFVGTYELMMLLVRASARRTNVDNVHVGPPPVPGTTETAAEASLRATIAAGNPLSVNQLAERFSLTRAQATKVRQRVLAESNGHATDDADGDAE
jgi:Protein of unknown function (DUF2637)